MAKILLVEDNEMNRDLISRKLKRQGFEVTLALDGAEGVEKASEEAPDLILMDMGLPVLDGYAATRLLKGDEQTRGIPVIGLSAHAMSGDADRALEAGCDDYDTKPVEWKRLLPKIRQYLERTHDAMPRARAGAVPGEDRHAEHLLRVLFPEPLVEELRATRKILPRRHPDVAVLFCGVADFDARCDAGEPLEVLSGLQRLVVAHEEVLERHGALKVKTSGDTLVAAVGLYPPLPDPALDAVRCALALRRTAAETSPDWDLRIGVDAGPVIAGVVGRRSYRFDLWGSTVRDAAAAQARGAVNAVNVSAGVWRRLGNAAEGEVVNDTGGDGAIYRVDRLAE